MCLAIEGWWARGRGRVRPYGRNSHNSGYSVGVPPMLSQDKKKGALRCDEISRPDLGVLGTTPGILDYGKKRKGEGKRKRAAGLQEVGVALSVALQLLGGYFFCFATYADHGIGGGAAQRRDGSVPVTSKKPPLPFQVPLVIQRSAPH